MTDFPPNPEDGELWLPSDVFHEIAYSNMTLATSTPPNGNSNGGACNTTHHYAPNFLVHQPNISPTPTSLPYPPPFFHQVFPSGDPNGIGSIGNGVPIFNNHYYYSYASWNGVFQLFPGSIHFFHPFTPTPFQGFVECPDWPLQEISSAKCEGTGVFLPRSADHHNKPQQQVVVQKSYHKQIVANSQELEESSGGGETGVFLDQQVHVFTARKKKKSKLQIKLA